MSKEPEGSVRSVASKIAAMYSAAQPQADAAPTEEATPKEPEPDNLEIGPDEVPLDEASEEPDNSDLYEVTVNGEKKEVSLESLISNYSKGEDYTRKTQELSGKVKTEADKLVREKYEHFDNEVKRITEVTGMFETFLNNPIVTKEQLKKHLDEGDLTTYHQLKYQEEERVEILKLAKQHREEALKIAEGKRNESYNEWKGKQREILMDKLPELGKKENQERLAKYLIGHGFTDKEVSETAHAQVLIVAEKARRYDELVKNRKAEPIQKTPPKVIRKVGSKVEAKAGATQLFSDAKQRLAKSGSRADAAEAIRLHMQQTRR
jgi:hypothetical protein